MKKLNNYFDYNVPYTSQFRQMYITPYRFSQELRDYTYYMFTHPVHNKKYCKIFEKHCRPWDTNDMLKRVYLIIRYYQDYPQQFGHSMDNVVPHMIVAMWKTFIGINKKFRGAEFKKYYPADMHLLMLGKNKFLDIFLSDIETMNIIMHSDDMIKDRGDDVPLKGRRTTGLSMQEGGKMFEWLCTLD